ASGSLLQVTGNGAITPTLVSISDTSIMTTTGKLLDLTANAATTTTGLLTMNANGLTTGAALNISSTSIGLAAGELANFDHTIAVGTLATAKTGKLIDITASRSFGAAGINTVSDDYDTLSIIRSNIVDDALSGANDTLNAAGSALYVNNVSTQTSGTLEDTANGIEIVMTGGAEAQGNGLVINHTGTTTTSQLLELSSEVSTNTTNIIVITTDVAGDEDTAWRVRADGSTFSDNAYTGTGADYAEYFESNEQMTAGTIVAVDNNGGVRKANQGEEALVGIVSANPGFIGNNIPGANGDLADNPNYALVGLVGQVVVDITNEGGAIAAGDFITTSSTAGKGMKATKAGRVIGMALGSFTGTDGQVMVQVLNTWYDPGTGGAASSAKDFFVENRMQLGSQTITVNDDGNSNSKATASLTPTASYVEVNCLDANGCNLNVEETGARAGDLLYIASLNTPVTVGDRENILNGSNPELGNDDTASFIYSSGKANNLWLQLSYSDN
ncbi:hypothetical protein HY732_03795, partial [Candidatus Uhrbacteria bacterium]|nr:hypothetical protein [Candidatus Uhrbacteria bacterium]